ncbi:Uncharacterized protein dnm_029130 [Desulfonema magnum]|uniref:Uncharacterized protein n=1 Tax=Desulfonema magnum TaxID=45655 RepID=A0A975BK69_9BACT|nr:Uncharacterized protein dnm_029130 [Desulfonema magnum]
MNNLFFSFHKGYINDYRAHSHFPGQPCNYLIYNDSVL